MEKTLEILKDLIDVIRKHESSLLVTDECKNDPIEKLSAETTSFLQVGDTITVNGRETKVLGPKIDWTKQQVLEGENGQLVWLLNKNKLSAFHFTGIALNKGTTYDGYNINGFCTTDKQIPNGYPCLYSNGDGFFIDGYNDFNKVTMVRPLTREDAPIMFENLKIEK